MQIGIVSGVARKCGEAQYATFVSVGFFEDWIREHVPNARFVSPAVASAGTVDHSLRAIAGIDPGGRPGELAQVSIDLQPGDRVRLGDAITVQVTSSVAGQLMVFSQSADGHTFQLFPNTAGAGGRIPPGPGGITIQAGEAVSIPGPDDGFELTASPPTGKNRIIAIVVPAGLPLGDLLAAHADMQRILDDPDALIDRGNVLARRPWPADRTTGAEEQRRRRARLRDRRVSGLGAHAASSRRGDRTSPPNR